MSITKKITDKLKKKRKIKLKLNKITWTLLEKIWDYSVEKLGNN